MSAKHTTGEERQEAAGRALPAGRMRVLGDQSRIGFKIKKMGLYYVKGSSAGSTAPSTPTATVRS